MFKSTLLGRKISKFYKEFWIKYNIKIVHLVVVEKDNIHGLNTSSKFNVVAAIRRFTIF